ncbi:MAG: cell division protein FtsL [Pelagibacterales bacterium MED-G42]|nr:MAG: cell division protein FtsL [Pelagibacterales bacterium MED-G42]
MNKVILISLIIILVLSTAVIKNSTKRIEDEIFILNENIRFLNSDFENILLEYNYLSSAEKLMEYQSLYFEDELIQKDIEDIKIYKTIDKIKVFQDLKLTEE